jgi:hypothetical protein
MLIGTAEATPPRSTRSRRTGARGAGAVTARADEVRLGVRTECPVSFSGFGSQPSRALAARAAENASPLHLAQRLYGNRIRIDPETVEDWVQPRKPRKGT